MKVSAHQLISWLFIILFFLIPLTFSPYNFELFEFNKTIILFILTTLIVAVWISACWEKKQFIFSKHPLISFFFLFLITQLVSTVTSSDKYLSIWGYYSRFHQSFLHSLAYFLLFVAYLTWMTKKDSQKVIFSTLLSLFLVSSYALGQHFGIDANYWVQDVKNRVFSTLGQPNWLASFVLLAFFMVSYNYIKGYQWVSKYIKILSLGLFLSALFFSKSRSGFLGLLVSLVIFGLVKLFFSLKRRTKTSFNSSFNSSNQNLFIISLTLSVFLSIIVWNPFLPYSFHLGHSPQKEKKIIPSSKPTQLKITPSSKIREIVWRGGINLWRLNWKNTLVGTGVETFAFNYYLTRPKEHNLTSEWDYIYNKAHNEYLNFLVTTGVIGFSSYLLLIVASYFYLLRDPDEYTPSFMAGYTGFLVTNFFGFSVVSTALLFYLYPAIFTSLRTNNSPHIFLFNPLSNLKSKLFYFIILVSTFLTLHLIVNWWRADYFLAKGNKYLQNHYYLQATNYFLKATQLSPYHPLYKIRLALALSYQTLGYYTKEKELSSYLATSSSSKKLRIQPVVQQLKDLVQTNQQLISTLIYQAITASPTNLEYKKIKVKTEVILATINPNYYQKAVADLQAMIQKAPTDPKLPFNLGVIYEMMGQKELGKKYILQALSLKSDYSAALQTLHHLENSNPKK